MNEIQPSGDGAGTGDAGPGEELEIITDGEGVPDAVLEQVLSSLDAPDFRGMTRREISEFWDELGSFLVKYGFVFTRDLQWLLVRTHRAADEASGGAEARRRAQELRQRQDEDRAVLEEDGAEERGD